MSRRFRSDLRSDELSETISVSTCSINRNEVIFAGKEKVREKKRDGQRDAKI